MDKHIDALLELRLGCRFDSEWSQQAAEQVAALDAAIALMRGQSERRPAKEPEAIGEDPYLWPKKRLKFRFGDDQFVAEITIGPKGSWVNRLYQRVKSRHGHTDRRVWPAMNPSAKAKAALMHIRANERTGDIGATTGQPGEGK